MKASRLLKPFVSVALTVALVAGLAFQAQALERVRWKLQSAWGAKIIPLGPTGLRIQDTVKAVSGGKIQMRFHEPNALVPTLEMWGAISQGSLDVGFTTPGYHAGYVPAVSFFSAVPFGPGVLEYTAWMDYGGGNELKERIYGEHNLFPLKCLIIAPETSGWFRQRVNSVEELKGIKMRFFGLGALVMNKLGVSTQLLAGGDIFPALEKGVIDATEFSMPTMDLSYGFYQVAKFNYFPGWHQQSTMSELLMNKGKWEALSDHAKAIIRTTCNDAYLWSAVTSDALQFNAMAELEKKGVTFVTWPDSEIAKFRKAWEEVNAEKSAEDPLWAEITNSYQSFRDKYAIWGSRAYLK
ncbi:MAG: TRAP transporter substrate-binding protein [SAR324 cluster bacterium]|nr:TRAP transporter substrate-binding protein [SAR324 cluster bacterium]